MFGSQARSAPQVGSLAREETKDAKPANAPEKKQLTPTEPVWKTTEPLRSSAPPPSRSEAEPPAHSRETEADVRTLIIGPGVSVKGEITSCNRLIVEGKIEAKLADCPNVIIKQGGVFNGESTTQEADIQGSFDGNLVVRGRLFVRATGTVAGNIAYGEIEIERGGKISGQLSADTDGAVPHLKSV
jgi:cytoskeletal protein CcmA (bactofilin family)